MGASILINVLGICFLIIPSFSIEEFQVVYLVQSDICVDLSHLQSKASQSLLLIGNDFLETERGCLDAIYLPKSTWVQRRNRLYEEMFDRFSSNSPAAHPFTYIIMADGGANMFEVEEFGKNTGNAWRTFEAYLAEYQPAVGVPRVASSQNSGEELQMILNFHQSVVAYHVEAAPLLLPYVERFDETSSCSSGLVQIALCTSVYSDKVLQFNALQMFHKGLSHVDDCLSSPSASTSLQWIASSLRRLTDYLSIFALDQFNSTLRKLSLPSRTQPVANSRYLVHAQMGIFDPCHPYFIDKVNYYKRLYCVNKAFPASTWNPVFYAFNDLGYECSGGGTIFDQLQQEHHFLFLQELGHQVKLIQTGLEDSLPNRSLPETENPSFDIWVAYPVNDTCSLGESTREMNAVQIFVQHMPSWTVSSPEQMYIIVVTVRNASWSWTEKRHVIAPPSSSGVGWPTVSWYRELDTNAISNFKISGIDSHDGVYELLVDAFSKNLTSVPRDPLEILPWADWEVEEFYQDISNISSRTFNLFGHCSSEQDALAQVRSVKAANELQQATQVQIVYLVQHHTCINLSHLQTTYSKVILLTWRDSPGSECPQAIFYPNSTLVQGRNRLYKEMLVRFPSTSPAGHPFTYIVIMDGDAYMVEAKDFGKSTGNAWRTFEAYLVEYEPAVGVPHFGNADYDSSAEVQLVFNFDQIVVAYHAEAALLLLPYVEIFDNISWWYCGAVQNALCAAAYNEHRIQFNALRVLSFNSGGGGEFSPYKRGTAFIQALRWIATGIVSLDAVLRIPWHNHFQSAVMTDRLEDRTRMPKKKGSRLYHEGLSQWFDFCHEYFDDKQSLFVCTKLEDREKVRLRGVNARFEGHLCRLAERMDLLLQNQKCAGSDRWGKDPSLFLYTGTLGTLAEITISVDRSKLCTNLAVLQMKLVAFRCLSIWKDSCWQDNCCSGDDSERLGFPAPEPRIFFSNLSSCALKFPCASTVVDNFQIQSNLGLLEMGQLSISGVDAAEQSYGGQLTGKPTDSNAGIECRIVSPLNLSMLVVRQEMTLDPSSRFVVAQCTMDSNSHVLNDDCRLVLELNREVSHKIGCDSPTVFGRQQVLQASFELGIVSNQINEIRFRLEHPLVDVPWQHILALASNLDLSDHDNCVPKMVVLNYQPVYWMPTLHYQSNLWNRLVTEHTVPLQIKLEGCHHSQSDFQVKIFRVVSISDSLLHVESQHCAAMERHDHIVELKFADFGSHLVVLELISGDGEERLLTSRLMSFDVRHTVHLKHFCYLVQASERISTDHLRSTDSEVIQLIWRGWTEWEEKGYTDHVIFFPNSTLVQGRNRLFYEVRERFPTTEFQYLIFLDDDVDLLEWGDFGKNTGDGWRTFERYLLEWEPAVGFPSLQNCLYRRSHIEAQTMFAFDQIVVAYHWETWPVLLPYTEVFDDESWWYCATVQQVLCSIFYRDHKYMFNAVEAVNKLHRYSGITV